MSATRSVLDARSRRFSEPLLPGMPVGNSSSTAPPLADAMEADSAGSVSRLVIPSYSERKQARPGPAIHAVSIAEETADIQPADVDTSLRKATYVHAATPFDRCHPPLPCTGCGAPWTAARSAQGTTRAACWRLSQPGAGRRRVLSVCLRGDLRIGSAWSRRFRTAAAEESSESALLDAPAGGVTGWFQRWRPMAWVSGIGASKVPLP